MLISEQLLQDQKQEEEGKSCGKMKRKYLEWLIFGGKK